MLTSPDASLMRFFALEIGKKDMRDASIYSKKRQGLPVNDRRAEGPRDKATLLEAAGRPFQANNNGRSQSVRRNSLHAV